MSVHISMVVFRKRQGTLVRTVKAITLVMTGKGYATSVFYTCTQQVYFTSVFYTFLKLHIRCFLYIRQKNICKISVLKICIISDFHLKVNNRKDPQNC